MWKLLTTEILNDMNNKVIVGGIFCDLAKAFDGVNHNVWLAKLKLYALYCRDYALYKSYMENRCQRTAPCYEKEACNKVSTWA